MLELLKYIILKENNFKVEGKERVFKLSISQIDIIEC